MDISGRGFAYSKFTDLYGMKCSIQESSLATDNAIWFGIDDPEPKVMAIDASSVGVKTEEITGWVPYPIPEIVCLHTRMHLNKEQVKALIPILQNFVETGELKAEAYIKRNAHNLRSPRIYGWSGYRNYEWINLRNYFLGKEVDI